MGSRRPRCEPRSRSPRPARVVSAYTSRRSGSPKSGSSAPGKPPTNPLAPYDLQVRTPPTSCTRRNHAAGLRIPASLEHGNHLVAAVRMEVVVAEHGIDRALWSGRQASASTARLVGVTVRRQVTSEKDDVNLRLRDGAKGVRDRSRSGIGRSGCRLRRRRESSRSSLGMFTSGGFHKRIRGYTPGAMAYTPAENFPELIDSMKRAAAALRDAEVPYVLGGGLAAWAPGGPPTKHDVDFFVRERRRRACARCPGRRGDESRSSRRRTGC